MIIDDEVFAAILTPIDGGVGTDARETDNDALSDRFRELRSQRKAIFRDEQRLAMGSGDPDPDTWSWDDLAEHAIEFLRNDAKDLEPMAMLIEAAVRADELAGLERSMNLLAGLVEAFWDVGLYPPADEEDGVEARFQPLSGLSGGTNDKDGALVMPLRRIVLARGANGDLRFIDRISAETQFANAQRAEGNTKAAIQKAAEEAFTALEANALTVPVSALKVAVGNLESAEAAWRRTIEFIIGRTKPLMPAASRVTEELRKMREWLGGVLKKLPDEPEPEAEAAVVVAGDSSGASVAVGATRGGANAPFSIGQISNRQEALQAVNAAAEYFARIEPNSPLASALKEVDRRARMSLNALIEELIPDASARQLYYWRSGIKPPEAEG